MSHFRMPSKNPRVCEGCGADFLGPNIQKFCSRNCAKISLQNRRKILQCRVCSVAVECHAHAAYATCVCCKEKKQQQLNDTTKPCELCKKENSVKRYSHFCKDCLKLKQHEFGAKSAAVQAEKRRSSNEILFADMCKEKFDSVMCNEPIFEKWDADVLLHEQKIAVLWNGPWHHRKLRQKHSVEQVKTRDKLKLKAIKRCGWTPYVIDDFLGKKNDAKFVQHEFEKFVDFVRRNSFCDDATL
jgi:hypothetical protein